MTTKEWPFPGDSMVVRARKMALAYRNTATNIEAELNELKDKIGKIDPRILGWIEDHDLARDLIETGGQPRTDQVHDLDVRFREWGEEWHAEVVVTYEDDDLVNGEQAAALLQIHRHSVNRARQRGRLPARLEKHSGDHKARWYFRVGDLYALQAQNQAGDSHDSNATDTVPDETGDRA